MNKTLPIYIKSPIIILAICAFICAIAGISFADDSRGMRSAKDRGHEDPVLYRPGWVMDSVLDSANLSRNIENTQKYSAIESAVANAPKKDTQESDNTITLQKKKSSAKEGAQPNAIARLIDPSIGDVKMGTGTDQRDQDGNLTSQTGNKMVSEVIGGVRYVYAGFDNDKVDNINIQKALGLADGLGGGTVLVRGGDYYWNNNVNPNMQYHLNNDVKIYGGYNSNGVRNDAPTTITGNLQLNYLDENISSGRMEMNGLNLIGNIFTQNINLFIANSTLSSSLGNVDAYSITFYGNRPGNELSLLNNRIDGSVSFNTAEGVRFIAENNDFTGNAVKGTILNISWGEARLFNNRIHGYGDGYANAIKITGATVIAENNTIDAPQAINLGGYRLDPNNPETITLINNQIAGSVFSPAMAEPYVKLLYSSDPMLTPTLNPTLPDGTDISFDYYSAPAASITMAEYGNYGFSRYVVSDDSSFLKYKSGGTADSNKFEYAIKGAALDNLKDSGLTNLFNKARSNNENLNSQADLVKFYHSYIDSMAIDLTMPLKETYTLDELIVALSNNDKRTDIEDDLLEAARAVIEESAYLDQETIKEFQEAVVDVARVVSDLRGIMKEEDFRAISKGLVKLVEERDSIYSDYLKRTQALYEKLEKLLNITIQDEDLPDTYAPLYRVNTLARKKVAIDLALENLKAKDEGALKNNQKEALKIDRETLNPLREEYLNKLKLAIADFVWDMKEVIRNKEPVSILKDDYSMKSLILLNESDVSSRASLR